MPIVGPFIDTSISPLWYFNSWPGIPGTTPPSVAPNQYSPGAFYRRLVADVTGVGVVTCKIWAIPYTGNLVTTVGAWLNNAPLSTLSYNGSIGIKAAQTLTITGSGARLLELEEQAVITNITDVVGGTITFRTATAPSIGFLLYSDSVGRGVNATQFNLAYFTQVRHSLSSAYGSTNWGVSGKTMNVNDGVLTAQRCFGTTKNIVVNTLGVNNWNNGSTAAFWTNATQNWYNTLIAQGVTGLSVGIVVIPNTSSGPAVGGGDSLLAFQNAQRAFVSANPSVRLLDWGSPGIYPIIPPSIYSPDGIHPADAGELILTPSMTTFVQGF